MTQEVPRDVVARCGVAHNRTGAAAYYGDGEHHPRDGTNLAAYLARRLVVALHVDRLGYDSQRQPPDRRGVAYRVNYER